MTADETVIHQLTTEAYAVRFLDALRQNAMPAIRQHNGTDLIDGRHRQTAPAITAM